MRRRVGGAARRPDAATSVASRGHAQLLLPRICHIACRHHLSGPQPLKIDGICIGEMCSRTTLAVLCCHQSNGPPRRCAAAGSDLSAHSRNDFPMHRTRRAPVQHVLRCGALRRAPAPNACTALADRAACCVLCSSATHESLLRVRLTPLVTPGRLLAGRGGPC